MNDDGTRSTGGNEVIDANRIIDNNEYMQESIEILGINDINQVRSNSLVSPRTIQHIAEEIHEKRKSNVRLVIEKFVNLQERTIESEKDHEDRRNSTTSETASPTAKRTRVDSGVHSLDGLLQSIQEDYSTLEDQLKKKVKALFNAVSEQCDLVTNRIISFAQCIQETGTISSSIGAETSITEKETSRNIGDIILLCSRSNQNITNNLNITFTAPPQMALKVTKAVVHPPPGFESNKNIGTTEELSVEQLRLEEERKKLEIERDRLENLCNRNEAERKRIEEEKRRINQQENEEAEARR